MLQFVYGCPGGGKSYYIARIIAERSRLGKKVILIVPERFSLTAEQQICALCDKEQMLNVEILSFKRLCNRVFREYGGLCYNYAGTGVQMLMTYRALCSVKGELLNFSSLQLRDMGTIGAIHQSILAFRRAGVPFEQLLALSEDESLKGRKKLKEKLYDHGLIGRAYGRLLHEEYDDPEEDLTRLYELLCGNAFFADKEVFVDATAAFSVQELKILERVLEQGAPLTVVLQMRQGDKRAFLERIRYCKSALEEVARRQNSAVVTLAECDRPYLKKAEDLVHLEKQFLADDPKPFAGTAEHLTLEGRKDPYEECKAVAARILRDVVERGGRFLDHGVAVRNMEEYKGLLTGVFEANGIPYTIASPVRLASRPEARVLLLVLHLYSGGVRFEDMRSYLKSGYSTLEDEECFLLEDYANLWRIEGMRWIKGRPFTMNPLGHTSLKDARTEERLALINSLKERLARPLAPLFEKLSRGKQARDHAAALYEYMRGVCMYERLSAKEEAAKEAGDGQEAQWIGATYEAIVSALDEVVMVFREDPMDAEEFLLALSTLFESKDLGSIPGGKDRVLLSDVFNLKPGSLKHLYILGMNDGVFPTLPSGGGMFGQADLKALKEAGIELSKESRREILDEQYSAYAALTLPYESLYVSWHERDLRGNDCSPSELAEHLKALFENRKKEEGDLLYGRAICLERGLLSDGTPESLALKHLFEKESGSLLANVKDAPLVTVSEALSPDDAERLYGTGPLRISKSRLETFINCPFSYTCKYLLKLREPQSDAAGVNEIGTIFHLVFEELIEETKKEGVSFGSLSNEQLKDRVDGIVSRIGRELVSEEEDESRVFEQLLRRVRNAAVVFSENLRDEFEESAFTPAFCELPFGGGASDKFSLPALSSGGAHPVIINGIADRVDVYRTEENIYLRVVDYKTGKVLFKKEDLEKGYNLQLLLYLRALRDCKDPVFLKGIGAEEGQRIVPAGVQYYLARKPAVFIDRKMDENGAKRALGAGILRSGWLINDEKMKEALGILGAEYAKKNHEETDLSELNDTLDGLDDILSDFAGRIKQGDATATPDSLSEGDSGCKYCKMLPVCRNKAGEQ